MSFHTYTVSKVPSIGCQVTSRSNKSLIEDQQNILFKIFYFNFLWFRKNAYIWTQSYKKNKTLQEWPLKAERAWKTLDSLSSNSSPKPGKSGQK